MAGSFGIGRWHEFGKVNAAASQPKPLYYKCPMHPATRSDKPGKAPDCGMDMVPVYADSGDSAPAGIDGAVQISPEKQQLIGVRLGTVETGPAADSFRSLGRVIPDEARVYPLTAKVDGWVRQIFPDSTGSLVHKGQPLIAIYSKDLQTAQQGYLFALKQLDRFRTGDEPDALDRLNLALRESRTNLETMGMSPDQIEAIAKTRVILPVVNLVAPADGFIITRAVYAEQRFEKGAELYKVVDLRHVWIMTDAFEGDSGRIASDSPAHVSLPHQSNAQSSAMNLEAHISNVLPQFDPSTRTMKIRLEADNPGFVLRPDMFVDVEVRTRSLAGLSVPVDAVIDQGMTKTVFVDRGNGFFEPRRVRTGLRSAGRVEIVSGLSSGERIVVSGNFLIDSESRMQAGGFHAHD
jgi:membrane fusion protein, copper/silver efflux system